MPLRTGEPLPRSAIVTNEDFFSHAKEVLRGLTRLAKRCFPGGVPAADPGKVKKDYILNEKRLARAIPVSTMRLESSFYYEHDDRA